MKKLFFLLVLFIVPVLSIFAHPHVFVNSYAHFYFNDKGMSGMYIQWVFDPLYSSQILYECDLDSNEEFSSDEIAEVKDYYFSQLDQYNYYLALAVDKNKIKVPEPVNFTAQVDKEDEVVVFTFFLPLEEEFEPGGTEVMVDFTDPTSYTAFTCAQSSLSLNGETEKVRDVMINRLGSIEFTFEKR